MLHDFHHSLAATSGVHSSVNPEKASPCPSVSGHGSIPAIWRAVGPSWATGCRRVALPASLFALPTKQPSRHAHADEFRRRVIRLSLSLGTVSSLSFQPELDATCPCGLVLSLWSRGHGDVLCDPRRRANIHGCVMRQGSRPNDQVAGIGANTCEPLAIRPTHCEVVLLCWRSTLG